MTKGSKLDLERQWLLDINAHCVLSDAAFLGWCVPIGLVDINKFTYIPRV